MNDQPVPDFDADERSLVAQLLIERYGRIVVTQDADAELRLDPSSPTLTVCPTLYWQERGAHFVVSKLGSKSFRCEFFYEGGKHFGTGIDRYDELRRCVLTLLQVQADHERDTASKAQ